jgi:glycosyltransferase involved in cell wall biosynthesis
MIHLFLNAMAASAGAGLTYVRNVVPQISCRNDVRATVLLSPQLRQEFENTPKVYFIQSEGSGTARRFWQEQTVLPRLIRQSGAEALISTGNFALRRSPVPQILLSGNSLYTSSDFYRDLRTRRAWGIWLDTRVKAVFAKRSIYWADATVAPSRAFADVLQSWTGREVLSIHHGFDREAFFRDAGPLPEAMQEKIRSADGALKLLFVSHYNYYRNFETLFRALPLLRERLAGREVRLFLTCELRSGANPGSYRTESALALVKRLGIEKEVINLGTVPYHLLHDVYCGSDIYVTPAYTETFAHPLVEAMASGLPVVASDIPAHREVCLGSGLFFDRFSAEHLAQRVLEIVHSKDRGRELAARGRLRSEDFSWQKHVDQIVTLARALVQIHGATGP